MPLKLNCGLSRKIGEANYGSRGASINVELELDSGIITDPAKLQDRIRQAFSIVRTSLDEELNGNGHAQQDNGQGTPASNGNGTSQNGGQRRATQSQVKAIHAIARNRRIDVSHFLTERFHVNRPEDLSIKEASTAIDELKEGRST